MSDLQKRDNYRPAKRKGKLDRFDRILSHLVDGAPLNEQDREMLAKYRKAHGMLCLGYGSAHVLQVLENEFGISEPQAYKIIRDASNIYGNVEEMDMKAKRKIYERRFENIAIRARKAEDFKSELSATKEAAKYGGADDKGQQGDDPKKFMRPQTIEFTSDPEALKAQQQLDYPDAEETDFVEVEE